MLRQHIDGNHIMSADEDIQLACKLALGKVQVGISGKHLSVWNNIMVGEHKRASAQSAPAETRGSSAEKNTLAEVLECGVH